MAHVDISFLTPSEPVVVATDEQRKALSNLPAGEEAADGTVKLTNPNGKYTKARDNTKTAEQEFTPHALKDEDNVTPKSVLDTKRDEALDSDGHIRGQRKKTKDDGEGNLVATNYADASDTTLPADLAA